MCYVKQFAICLGVFASLLLKVMELLCVVVGTLLDRPCMVFIECVCCACGPSARLDAPSICFCMSEVISSFRSLRTGSQMFAFLMLFLCVILHTMHTMHQGAKYQFLKL